MAQVIAADIGQGWKVFAGSEVVGHVASVSRDTLAVKSGRLVKHEYFIPIEYVSDAADGVVDLKIARDDVMKFEPAK